MVSARLLVLVVRLLLDHSIFLHWHSVVVLISVVTLLVRNRGPGVSVGAIGTAFLLIFRIDLNFLKQLLILLQLLIVLIYLLLERTQVQEVRSHHCFLIDERLQKLLSLLDAFDALLSQWITPLFRVLVILRWLSLASTATGSILIKLGEVLKPLLGEGAWSPEVIIRQVGLLLLLQAFGETLSLG